MNPAASVGLVRSTHVMGTAGGFAQSGINYAGDGNVYSLGQTKATLGAYNTGTHTIDVAVDLDAKLIWFRRNNGNWNNSGTANPATGVGGISFDLGTGQLLHPAFDIVFSSGVTGSNFGATSYARGVPSGFGNW
jgi:hypothetical protein